MMSSSAILVALLQAGSAPAIQGQPAPRFDLEAAGRIVQLGDPGVSPDGRQVVVVARRANYETNRHEAELLLIEVASGASRSLVPSRKAVWSPRWSPSGDRLAFLAPDSSGAGQLWILPMTTAGEARVLTSLKLGVRQFAWRPDGTALAIVTDDEPAAREGTERHNKSFEVERNDYLASAAPRSRHLWLMPSSGGSPKRLTSGGWSLATLNDIPVSWTPDGTRVVYTRQPGPGSGHWYDVTVEMVEVESGRTSVVVPSFGTSPVVSPDGKLLAYSAPRGKVPEFTTHGIYVTPLSGGRSRLATGIDIALWEPNWLDAATLLVCGTEGTTSRLWTQRLDGRPSPIALGDLQPTCDLSTNAGGIAFVAAAHDRAGELYWLDRPGAAPRRLTDLNGWMAGYAYGRPETVDWKSDGFNADGALTLPVGFDPARRYPLLLYIHGGPMGQSSTAFDPLVQMLAAQGWLIFQPNYRGSTGLGNAYQSAVVGDAGDGPGRDVMAGVEVLIKRGIVDTTRMGVSGWSYGGYMTSWLLSHYPRWKAGLAGAAVTDYADGYYLADYGPAFGGAWGGSPFKPPYNKIVRDQSPITYAGQIKAPTLILATTGDARVPVVQSYKLYRALKDFGVPVSFVAYPVPGHFPGDPVHVRDIRRRWVGWFGEHFGTGGAPVP